MFSNINEVELDQLKDAISLITVLVAGADGKIDNKEKEWATKLTDIRSYSNSEDLQPFYESVGLDFETRLDNYIESLPDSTAERNDVIQTKLALLNPTMAKLNNKIGAALYASYVSFAKHVATASGGFFRIGSISGEESKVISLGMIEPIYYEEPEEEIIDNNEDY